MPVESPPSFEPDQLGESRLDATILIWNLLKRSGRPIEWSSLVISREVQSGRLDMLVGSGLLLMLQAKNEPHVNN